MYGGKICVPTPLQERVIYDHHQFFGHVGFQRIRAHMEVRYQWGDNLGAKKFAREVMGVCESCQACQRTRSLKSPIESTLIPPAIMSSVCMDLFSLPPVVRDKKL